ncbi:MAGUK p55 subfamily member 3 isoform X8 [Cebus imitator]|uniref:MAGUK p55 subfamily member 3 isoform X8 n=1 Tax=Cebus imitator TaxID=2715852 RepID=UPI001899877F|nr:MAGUK p55 subfamily member 3 isoform X8 [Cebus imitator]
MPVLSEDSGLHETLALLTSQLRPDSNHKEEMGFLRDVFSEKSLSYLMKIHEKLRYYERQSPTPVLHSAVALAEDVMEELQAASVHGDERELLQLLSTPHLRAVLMVHDTVAQKNFDPVLPPLPDNIDEDFDEESVKIVRLVKNKEPLGATIRRDEHSGAVVVARIMRGGAADRSGPVPGIHHPKNHPSHPGGRLLKGEQDDQPCDKETCDCEGYLKGHYVVAGGGWEKSVGLSSISRSGQVEKVSTGRSWDKCHGVPLPPSQAGLRRSFRLGCRERLGGLQEGKMSSGAESPELLTYEEVARYQHQPGELPRLVVLIGSLGARLHELKQKVVAENPQHFGVAVPHTTRPRKSHEKEGVEYHFVSKQAFEADLHHNKFLEHGEYKENLYGTSLEAIQAVMAKNKVCLVDVEPEALKQLRTSEFKPYIIFVKPAIQEKRQTPPMSPACEDTAAPLDEEQQEMAASAAFIDQHYGHLVDAVLVKEDLQGAYSQLIVVLEKLSKDTHWVPVSWVR